MWAGLLIVAAEESSSGSGPPAALIITAVCTGIAAIITALSLIFRRTGSDSSAAPAAEGGARPMGERVAVVEYGLGTAQGNIVELNERLEDLEAWRREHQWTHGETANG